MWLVLQFMVLGENMEKVCSTAVPGKVRVKGKTLLQQTLIWKLILDDV